MKIVFGNSYPNMIVKLRKLFCLKNLADSILHLTRTFDIFLAFASLEKKELLTILSSRHQKV
ncbi:hypothetical protein BpHYR1_043036 [Brachionus plicatilis]|uniref:Uncharacterized protein n=1 Tax=Brachionus plicatilis TaxID=10195 RepID=A0A3M7QLV6_BRAPC|nr:hypothetical protein BpHYR1_043036 [Brachionus plicatilis]